MRNELRGSGRTKNQMLGSRMNNSIQTWQQGRFIDQSQYSRWTMEEKIRAHVEESFKVRPSPLGGAICQTQDPYVSEWIAARLNLAAKLEGLVSQLLEDRISVEDFKLCVK